MSVDSSESPTKNRWQERAEKLLASVENIRKETSNDDYDLQGTDEVIDNESLQQLLKSCISLSEMEKIINEAETYDIYDKNEAYDKLVDYHIKALNNVKLIRRFQPLRLQTSLKKVKQTAVKILKMGIRFKEIEELFVQINLQNSIETMKHRNVTMNELVGVLNEVDKYPGVADPEVLDILRTRRRMAEYSLQKLDLEPKILYLRDLEDSILKPKILEFKTYKVEARAFQKLECLVKFSEMIRQLYRIIMGEDSTIENLETLVETMEERMEEMMYELKNDKDSLFAKLDDSLESNCKDLVSNLPVCLKVCELRDEETLINFCSKLQSFLWKLMSTRLLLKNNEEERVLESCIKDAPETNSNEYALITERLHSIRTAKTTEKKIRDQISFFWSCSVKKLLDCKDRFSEFLKESTSYFNDTAIDKQINNLVDIMEIFESDTIDSENLSKLTKEFEAYNKGYELLDEIKAINSAVELSKMYKEKVEYTWNRNMKTRQSLKGKRCLRDVEMIPRVEAKKAQEYLRSFKKVDARLIGEFKESIERLEGSLENLNKFSDSCTTFELTYNRSTLMSLECSQEITQEAFNKFDGLMEEYMNLEIKDITLEQFLDQNDLFIKAQALLKNILIPELRRDISSWESIIQKLKKYGTQSKDIVKLMENKMKIAEKLLMEAHKMRQFESQSILGGREAQAKQSRMLSTESLQEIVKSYEQDDSHIELQDTMMYLEKVQQNYEDLQNQIQKITHLRQMEELLVNFQRQPILVHERIYKEIEDKMVQPLLLRKEYKDLMTTSPIELIKNFKTWEKKIKNSDLVIEEWEEFLTSYKLETEFEQNLSKLLVPTLDIDEVQEIKKRYQNQKLVKNQEMEMKILGAEISAIQAIYEKRLFEEEKPGRLFSLEELTDLSKKCESILGDAPNNETDFEKKFCFIKKFLEDIKKFMDDKILNTSSLEGLSLNLERNPFADMVDLSNIISDQKAMLNQEAAKYGPGSVKIRQSYINAIVLLLEKNAVFNTSGIDLTATAKHIEKNLHDRCLNRAQYYEDYAKQVCKIIQRLIGFSAISGYLKEKNFEFGLIEKLFPKSKQEFHTLEDNIVKSNKRGGNNNGQQKEGAPDSFGFNYFKIFTGALFFNLREGKSQKKVENAELMTCTPLSVIKQFAQIPNKLLLSMSITVEEFQNYIQKAIINDTYVVMPCFARFPGEASASAKSYMEKNQLVASGQYSKSCKLFIFPKQYLRPEWLKALEFYMAREDNEPIDFLCFTVFKKAIADEYSNPIAPTTLEFKPNCMFYQIYSLYNNVIDRIVDPTILLQNRKPIQNVEVASYAAESEAISCDDYKPRKKNRNYEDFFYNEDEMDEENQLVIEDDVDENQWESHSNDWSGANRYDYSQPKLLNFLAQPVQSAQKNRQNFQHNPEWDPMIAKRPPIVHSGRTPYVNPKHFEHHMNNAASIEVHTPQRKIPPKDFSHQKSSGNQGKQGIPQIQSLSGAKMPKSYSGQKPMPANPHHPNAYGGFEGNPQMNSQRKNPNKMNDNLQDSHFQMSYNSAYRANASYEERYNVRISNNIMTTENYHNHAYGNPMKPDPNQNKSTRPIPNNTFE
jgi:hypothetical protein